METTNNNINEQYADLITKKAAKESEIRMLKYAHECDRRTIAHDTEKKLEVCRQHMADLTKELEVCRQHMADLTKERDNELLLRHDAFIAKKDALLGELAAINAEMARIKMPEEV